MLKLSFSNISPLGVVDVISRYKRKGEIFAFMHPNGCFVLTVSPFQGGAQ